MLTNDLVRVRHILDAARQALAFMRGRSRGDLDQDAMLNPALHLLCLRQQEKNSRSANH